MSTNSVSRSGSAIPADDRRRNLVIQDAENDKALHLGLVGDTYTILLSGGDTAGKFCLIDMHVPPGGGPPPYRHDPPLCWSIRLRTQPILTSHREFGKTELVSE